MGERKGTNKYYPPDYDPKRGGLNKFMGTHALRERASKLHLGILIIRFEMPFNVWCEGCGNHVGMGVRYNAEKKQVDMYYTTPVFEFRMKCHLCDNYFVIRTDPEHFDYECVEGLRRQERRWDMSENEQIASMEKEKSRKLAADAMFRLEHVESDQAKAKAAGPAVEKLEVLQHRMKDDFARNQELRRSFRTKKNEMKKAAEIDKKLLSKSSLDIDLVPESEEDRRLASMIAKYRTVESVEEKRARELEKLDKRSIFPSKSATSRKRYSSAVSSPSTSTGSSSVTDLSKGKQVTVLKDGLREARMSSKLAKLDRDLDHQQASALKIVVKKKSVANGESNGHSGTSSASSQSGDAPFGPDHTSSNVDSHANNLSLLKANYDSSDSSPSTD